MKFKCTIELYCLNLMRKAKAELGGKSHRKCPNRDFFRGTPDV